MSVCLYINLWLKVSVEVKVTWLFISKQPFTNNSLDSCYVSVLESRDWLHAVQLEDASSLFISGPDLEEKKSIK